MVFPFLTVNRFLHSNSPEPLSIFSWNKCGGGSGEEAGGTETENHKYSEEILYSTTKKRKESLILGLCVYMFTFYFEIISDS